MKKSKLNHRKGVIEMKKLVMSILAGVIMFSVSTTAFGYWKAPAGTILQDPCPMPFKNISIK